MDPAERLAIAIGSIAAVNFERQQTGIPLSCTGAFYELTPVDVEDNFVLDMPVKAVAYRSSDNCDRVYFNFWHLGSRTGTFGLLATGSIPLAHTYNLPSKGSHPDIAITAKYLYLNAVPSDSYDWQPVERISERILYSMSRKDFGDVCATFKIIGPTHRFNIAVSFDHRIFSSSNVREILPHRPNV